MMASLRKFAFQSTRPIRGATSVHHLIPGPVDLFQSTRPIRGATQRLSTRRRFESYFNPRAPYGARRCPSGICWSRSPISIHAPHTGRDARRRGANQGGRAISIHAPHTGRDNIFVSALVCTSGFQSTRPIRGATSQGWKDISTSGYFNPRAPYGARQWTLCPWCGVGTANFNPRAPYGARPHASLDGWLTDQFQSTRPIRGATAQAHIFKGLGQISIHAPHTGRDVRGGHVLEQRGISIHAPHTGRDLQSERR